MAMRVAVGQFNEPADEKLRFAQQLGVSSIQMNTPKLPGDRQWESADIKAIVDRVNSFGLTLDAIENVPIHFYDKAMLGLPGRDEQIEHYQNTIRHIGEAGVPVLGYHWMPNSVWRTSRTTPGRGGAKVTSFDLTVTEDADVSLSRTFVAKPGERVDHLTVLGKDEEQVSEATMWDNFTYFMKAVLPVAEEAGVTLALHPDDPPVPVLGGVARLFRDVDGFRRAESIVGDSPAWGLDLCLGCCSEMPGGAATVLEMIDHFGPQGKIIYVHFRDVQGTVPAFQECFLGEGNFDPAQVILALHRAGFDGFLLDDHVPHMDDDTPWNHRGRAHAIGYMQGLINAVELLA
ncbi:MAG: mannonate dehydratase [Thermomicrobiales bacterium]|nr:mannonate dehydratase [Thermomicrobiales bacterium]